MTRLARLLARVRSAVASLLHPVRRRVDEASVARVRAQPYFERLHALALRGMNYGDNDFSTNGERWLSRLVGELPDASAPVVLDVGANVGDYAAEVLAACGPRAVVHCFEPSGSAYEQLRARLSADARVTVHRLALGATPRTAMLYGDAPGSGMASLYERDVSHHGITVEAQEEVEVTTLDEVLRRLGVVRVHLLKLDVEGAELDVLRGAAGSLERSVFDLIQFEFGGTAIDARTYVLDFHRLLSPRYRLHRLVRDGLVAIDDYSERLEIFTMNHFVAVSRRAEVERAVARALRR